jgi:hypothetical protein
MSEEQCSRWAALAQDWPDPRKRRGRRYAWAGLLVLLGAAVASGQQTGAAIAQWVREHPMGAGARACVAVLAADSRRAGAQRGDAAPDPARAGHPRGGAAGEPVGQYVGPAPGAAGGSRAAAPRWGWPSTGRRSAGRSGTARRCSWSAR